MEMRGLAQGGAHPFPSKSGGWILRGFRVAAPWCEYPRRKFMELGYEERVVRVVTVVAIVCAVLCLGSAAGCTFPLLSFAFHQLLTGWYLLWQTVLSRIPFVRTAPALTSMHFRPLAYAECRRCGNSALSCSAKIRSAPARIAENASRNGPSRAQGTLHATLGPHKSLAG